MQEKNHEQEQEQPHNHDHPHDHNQPHDHSDHEHQSKKGLWGWIKAILHIGHSHDHHNKSSEQAFLDNEEGIRTVWISLALLLTTALIQLVIVYFSRSVSLLADTSHNIGDGLNSIPLLVAFYLARRLPRRGYSYGYGRAEDVAGIFIVLSIAFSAGVVFWQAILRFINPEPMHNLGWVAVAALLGYFGNEAVAILQIRVGRKINSAAMVADGMHARTDALTSLAVLVAAGGTLIGLPILDPIIGIVIGVAIVTITWDATKTIWYRLMDAVDPAMLRQAEKVVEQVEGVEVLRRVRMRWVGHCLHADICIAVEPGLTTLISHQIAEEVRHALFHEIKPLREIMVHVDPWLEDPEHEHSLTWEHEPVPQLIPE